jgi:hypothetical protein
MESTASNTHSSHLIRVYHLTGETSEGRSRGGEISFAADPALDATIYWFQGHYSHVADVAPAVNSNDAERLDDAFQLTNTIEWSWWRNTEVTERFSERHMGKGPTGCRSTSVGDIVALPNGRAFVCAPTGWVELDRVSEDVGRAV